MKQKWKGVVHTYTETNKIVLVVLGQYWLNEDTWKTINCEIRQQKVKWMKANSQRFKGRYGTLHSEGDKRVKWNARTYKRRYVDNVAAGAERSAVHQEHDTIFN